MQEPSAAEQDIFYQWVMLQLERTDNDLAEMAGDTNEESA